MKTSTNSWKVALAPALIESWLQVQETILNETVLATVDVLFELAVATARRRNSMLPSVHVKAVEVILKDKSVSRDRSEQHDQSLGDFVIE